MNNLIIILDLMVNRFTLQMQQSDLNYENKNRSNKMNLVPIANEKNRNNNLMTIKSRQQNNVVNKVDEIKDLS